MSPAARTLCGLLLGFLIPACSPTRGEAPQHAAGDGTQEIQAIPAPIEPAAIEPLAPPIVLGEPPVESTELFGEDVSKAMPSELARLAQDFSAGGNFSLAARYQYWYVRQTGEGRYDLARYYARAGAAESSLYWLHAAAREEGVDLEAVAREDAFQILLADSRWPAVRSYLQSSLRGWETQGQPATTLVLPQGYTKERGPIWVFAWFHDSGSNPHELIDPVDEDAECRLLADRFNIAFVGISGTISRGKKAYAWADDPVRDFERVQSAVAEVSKRLAIQPAGIVALGNGQGGRIALDLAARHPETFAGAIVLSPGTPRSRLAEIAEPHALLAKRSFVLGGSESETLEPSAWLEKAKARVTVEMLPAGGHAIPINFSRSFPNWFKIVQSAQN